MEGEPAMINPTGLSIIAISTLGLAIIGQPTPTPAPRQIFLSSHPLSEAIKNGNVQAFLQTIAFAEGTAGPDGYRMMFTGPLFNSFKAHPNVKNCSLYKGRPLCSTAAGRYQFLKTTWDEISRKLKLPDFSPESQDLAAVQLIKQAGGYEDIVAGRFDDAVFKLAPTWASFPTAEGKSYYNQPSKSLPSLRDKFQQAGGSFFLKNNSSK
ncbi:glycoside hydrolase family 104 protein [Ancylothrix sp. C2]|uniref:glycoside hydrolase family 24 protein n=1 Tax=Ancylothrix sp. D3o TaxID=2953691 RepID=UPI0021BB720A|nr:glycoside hydrolase family 104 protein [Ancylothrix sp. D3o]MCT7953096.1 glycoside hydrolase family 104 protein [Ancylothrix sp. D3o]